MNYQLSEIFDLAKLKELMESFHRISGISSGVIDLGGNTLIKIGWQDICIQFHSLGPTTQASCTESDRTVLSAVNKFTKDGEPYLLQKCVNGLYFAVTPIHLRGIHLGNFTLGQFLLEPPDLEEFIQRARRLGFSEE